MPDGSEHKVTTLYSDKDWRLDDEVDRRLNPGLSEFPKPLFDQAKR